jgi:hypothetical protein
MPTANLPMRRLPPLPFGVYAVRATVPGLYDGCAGVASLGVRPAVGTTPCLLEVHLFADNPDLYGREMCVDFLRFEREERNFDSLDALKRQMQLDADRVAVTVLDGDVEVQSRVRLPVCYWPFDDRDKNQRGTDQRVTTDTIQSLPAAFGDALQRCDGIVGQGAVQFDNSRGSFARVQGGTGEKVGLGTLSAAEGITVEALIISRWTAASMDYDEIYRKEDGNCRVLLSFQNDGMTNAGFTEPAVALGPCLSFGLHLAGRDYKELDMPLDGRDGRPTVADLTDGRPHHVVATYDSFTGSKAIFIDGTLRCEHVCPAGTLIVSGGPEPAFIGSHIGNENFHGVIDELALYDFALTADEIAEHHERTRRGETYFGPRPTRPKSARWQAITRITEGQTRIFNSRTGLAAE